MDLVQDYIPSLIAASNAINVRIVINWYIVKLALSKAEERILSKELMKKMIPFSIDDCLEHSLNLLFRHNSYTDRRVDDRFMADEDEPVIK